MNRPVEPVAAERSLSELLSEMTSELSLLMRKEVELAKVETKQEISKAVKGAGMMAGAGFTGYMSLLLLSFAAAWGLAAALPRGVAFLVVGIVYAVAAGVLFLAGRRRMREVNPVPEQTVETLKEDVEWARAQRS